MHQFEALAEQFHSKFSANHFPSQPGSLYDPNRYFLQLGGKRVRPVMCLMANELFGNITEDAWCAASALELFHNFTLIHDDIMDKAPLRRGMQTVHEKYGMPTALLAGDVMLVKAYDYLNTISPLYNRRIVTLFNQAASQVCEGQQLDMDYEQTPATSMDEYINMITLKTSVLLAASLQIGAVLGGALLRNQNLLYEFGRKLGIAFQIQDDYLDAFGDPARVGKKTGGDIASGKKTFLLIRALETLPGQQKKELELLLKEPGDEKIQTVLQMFRSCGADAWAMELKNKYTSEAFDHLDDVAVVSSRKEPLRKLAGYLTGRDY